MQTKSINLYLDHQYARSAYNKGEIYQFEIVQRKAARFVTNRQRNTMAGDMLKHLNWCSLEEKTDILVIMYKAANEQVTIPKKA